MCFVKWLTFLLVFQAGYSPLLASNERTLFAALNSMIDTVRHENKLLKAVEQYAHRRTEKLNVIRRVYDKWKQLHEETKQKLETDNSDRLAQFKLVQRITRYWPKFKQDFLDRSKEHKDLFEGVYKDHLMPDIKDVRGLTRLLLVNANIYGKSFDEMLDARSHFVSLEEYLELSYRVKFHELGVTKDDTLVKASEIALYGLNQSDLYQRSNELKLSQARWDLLSTMTDELYETGFWNLGYALCTTILNKFPDDDEFMFKVELFRDRLTSSNFKDKMSSRTALQRAAGSKEDTLDRKEFSKLCRRGELVLPPDSNLKCYYFHKNAHLRHIAGYKVEEISHSPVIRLYHDVILEGEIELIKSLAFPLLEVAKVYDPNDTSVDISEDRISNNAWLLDPDILGYKQPPQQAALYRKLNQRMEDCTTLNKAGTEGLQVNNYGIGGHYLWHYDSLYYNAELEKYTNDRIATWMFYLNDVIEGGNTVFPRLNISIPPVKGATLFWYNLHPTGKNDFRTLHGGCPILKGTKWVTNIWVREFEQTFIKPCLPGADKETSSWESFYETYKDE
ncbi:hypothetical protein M8J77_003841 [Diaphorina citri]|nr:hypothetical protein M8J77_003841 [Diaphorina citri]